jgi:SPP1 gp7 family putative phage head morphogenesis protein
MTETKGELDYQFWRDEVRRLTKILFTSMLASAIKSAKNTLARLLALTGIGVDYTLISEAALTWAKQNSLLVAEKVVDTTRKFVERELQDWIQSGTPIQDLISNLTESGLFDPVRAKAIAVTEVTNAYAKGNVIVWKASGVVAKKVWMTAQDELVCPECGILDGTDMGLDDDFRAVDPGKPGAAYGSHPTPPAHVNCRCWLQPVVEK